MFVNELSPDLSLAVLHLLLLDELNLFLVWLDLRHEPNLLDGQVSGHVRELLGLVQALRFFIDGGSGLHWQFHFCQINVFLDFEGQDVHSSDSALVEDDDFRIGLNVKA